MNCANCKASISADRQPDVILADCFYACPHCGREMFDGRTLHEWRYHEQLRRGLRKGDRMTIRHNGKLSPVRIEGPSRVRFSGVRQFPAIKLDTIVHSRGWDVRRFVYDLDAMKAHVARVNGL